MDNYQFDKKKHLHLLGGKPLTGTTTVLGIISKGDGLIQWSANEAVQFIKDNSDRTEHEDHDSYNVMSWTLEQAKSAWKKSRDKAGKSGTDVHAIIEEIIKDVIKNNNGVIQSGSNPNPQVQNFLDWAVSNKVKFLESELNVYSRDLWIGGIVDMVFEIDGEVYIGDIKTAKAIYPTNYWQMSAYQYCLTEMKLFDKIKGFKVIRCGKDGTFEIGENYAYDDNIDGFKSALNVYRKLNLIS